MAKLKLQGEIIMLKKLISGVVAAGLVVSLGFNALCYTGGAYETKLNVWINKIKVVVDGKEINKGNETTVNTILHEGTTYIPLRKVSENMGCKVDYNSNTATAAITNDNKKIEGIFTCKCIEERQEKNKTVFKFEIETAKGKQYGIIYGGDFEKGKYYASAYNEPNFMIDGNGNTKDIKLVKK